MKVCIKCKEEKNEDQFYKNYGVRYSICNPCKTIVNKETYAKNRKKLKKSNWYIK